MYTIIITLIILVSVLLCLIVLIQESKGGGLASSFSSSNQIMGVRKTTDVVEKTTWGLVIALVALSVVSVFFIPKAASTESVIMKEAPKAVNAGNMPMGAPQQPAAGNAAPANAAPAAPATQAPAQ